MRNSANDAWGEDMANAISQSQKFFGGDVSGITSKPSWSAFKHLPFQRICIEVTVAERIHIIGICVEGETETFLCISITSPVNPDGWISNGIFWIDKMSETASFTGNSEDLDIYSGAADRIARVLEVLNCSNVSSERIDPPEALNKKRIKAGKIPIYSYKVLVLRNNRIRLALGGTHDSPRVHLRRGHIKHRRSGDFWWQPHVVGDKKRGVVMKDYSAEQLIQNASA